MSTVIIIILFLTVTATLSFPLMSEDKEETPSANYTDVNKAEDAIGGTAVTTLLPNGTDSTNSHELKRNSRDVEYVESNESSDGDGSSDAYESESWENAGNDRGHALSGYAEENDKFPTVVW